MVEAYCVKCKAKGRKMVSPVISQTARGGYMGQGACPVMMSKENADKAIKEGAKKAF